MTTIKFEGRLNVAVIMALLCNASLGGWYANMFYSQMMDVKEAIKEVKQGGSDNTTAIINLKVALSNLSGKIDTLLEQKQANNNAKIR